MDKLTALSATKHITHTQRWSWLAYASIVVSAGQRFSRAARLSILLFFFLFINAGACILVSMSETTQAKRVTLFI